jgi:hypothetical protein
MKITREEVRQNIFDQIQRDDLKSKLIAINGCIQSLEEEYKMPT